MAKYTDNNIQFNSIDVSISGNSKKWGQAELANATDADLIEIASDNNGKLPTIVNSVEIDWNGATTTMDGEEKEINTTGELISYLATA